MQITFTHAVVTREKHGPDLIDLVFEHDGKPEKLTELEARGTAGAWLKRVGFGEYTLVTHGRVQVEQGLRAGQEIDGVVERTVPLGDKVEPVTIEFTKAVVSRGKDDSTPDRVNLFFEFPDGGTEDLVQELPRGSAEAFLTALKFKGCTLLEVTEKTRERGRHAGRKYDAVVQTEVELG